MLLLERKIGKSLNEIIRKLLLVSFLYCIIKKTINPVYKPNYNCKSENQVVLLMITNSEKFHYIALKSGRTDDGFNRPVRSLSILF